MSSILKVKDDNGNVHDIKTLRGLNAYQVAVAAGFNGSLQDWLDSLVGGSYDEQLAAIASGIDEIKDILENGDINIGGNSGIDTSDANATSSDMRENKSGYVNGVKIEGEVPTRNADNVTVENNRVNVPAGIYDEDVTKNLPQQSVSYVTQATPVISVNNDTGLVKATSTQEEGYVLGGTTETKTQLKVLTISDPTIQVYETGLVTASVSVESNGFYAKGSKSVSEQLPVKDSEIYTPGSEDQVVKAGVYLTGDQIIKGDENLSEENIAYGKTIFGKTGEYRGYETGDVLAEGDETVSGVTSVSFVCPFRPSKFIMYLDGDYTSRANEGIYTLCVVHVVYDCESNVATVCSFSKSGSSAYVNMATEQTNLNATYHDGTLTLTTGADVFFYTDFTYRWIALA